MSRDTADILEGAAYLIPALVVIFIAAKALAAFTNRRFAHALNPLLPVIAGTLRKDGLRGQIFGTHEGRAVAIEVIEGARSLRFPGHSNQKRNLWRIELTVRGGKVEEDICTAVILGDETETFFGLEFDCSGGHLHPPT